PARAPLPRRRAARSGPLARASRRGNRGTRRFGAGVRVVQLPPSRSATAASAQGVARRRRKRRAVPRLVDVVPLGRPRWRGRRVPGEGREAARLAARNPAAVEAARVAEDDRPLWCGERDGATVDLLRELVLRRIIVAERTPRPERIELAAGRTPRHVLEWTRLLVDVDEIEERLQEVAVVEVPVPALRGLPLVLFGWRRVPHVH